MKKIEQEVFIERAKNIFPQYDFSKSKYENNKRKIIVICPIHGEFKIRPDCLLNGTGCPICGGTHKMTTEEFIKKANFVHNGYFSYDKCVFNGVSNKVNVTCPIHGDFEVKANNHLNGCNCKKCQKNGYKHKITKLTKINASTKKLTTEEFIKKAKEKHGNKYSYEKVIYEKSNKHVLVTCSIHGDFLITPNHLLSGRGCAKCSKNYKYTDKEFIEKLITIFGEKYLYDKVEYVSTHKQILIGCKTHGYFKIQPSNLLRGEGCPKCNESKLEQEICDLLNEYNINFIQQKHFKWLGKQSLDFYLPEYNIGIECQGIQHFEPIQFSSNNEKNDERFRQIKVLDDKKRKLCEKNNIYLLYFANYKYKFPYEVITNKKYLMTKILTKHD